MSCPTVFLAFPLQLYRKTQVQNLSLTLAGDTMSLMGNIPASHLSGHGFEILATIYTGKVGCYLPLLDGNVDQLICTIFIHPINYYYDMTCTVC